MCHDSPMFLLRSELEADKSGATTSSVEWTQSSALCFLPVAAAPPLVGGAAPGPSTLSRDIEELQEIVGRLATTRSRTRQNAPHGVMTGMSPVSGTQSDYPACMALQSTGACTECWTAGRLACTCGDICSVSESAVSDTYTHLACCPAVLLSLSSLV